MRSLLLAFGASLVLSSLAGAQQDPPRRLDFGADSASQAPRRATQRSVGNTFVRDQTLLGAFVYAPAFAASVGDDGVTGAAAYLVVAGGTFFAATELTRRLEITEARRDLAFAMPLRGAATLWTLAYATELQRPQTGALVFLGGIGGLAAGLAMGRGLTEGEAAATIFGHDLGYLSGLALTAIIDGGDNALELRGRTGRVAAWTSAGIVGFLGGRRYAAGAEHNVTAGDVQAMWLGTSIGALAGSAVVVDADPSTSTTVAAMLVGGLAGTFAAERMLVRRRDHTRGEGNVLSLGASAGAIMGVGLGVLVGGELKRGTSLTLGLATVGALGGVVLTDRYLQPAGDQGRLTSSVGRVSFDPLAVVAAATRREGRHTILKFTF